ncbi:hypothetical protein V1477_001214 [Vespula maculifrons]|uniref:Uncharacterized protein n=3 Tax=Vespula TaxID=7451 RepID=A0A834K0Y3_VESGE|nr:hypothetical protein HZH66_008336 [Vespula vulgaris]KAF7395191.1 hypothetical protein HZH68_009241 [Vespula germanica]
MLDVRQKRQTASIILAHSRRRSFPGASGSGPQGRSIFAGEDCLALLSQKIGKLEEGQGRHSRVARLLDEDVHADRKKMRKVVAVPVVVLLMAVLQEMYKG